MAVLAIVGALALQAANAQATGVITGRVSNEATRQYLNNAIVIVEGANLTTKTDADGSFRISGVAPGTYNVTATFTDLDPATRSVTVTDGGTAKLDLKLTSEYYMMGQFVVTAEREGSAKAIHEQRTSNSQKSIFAADSFGNVVDSNLGELMKNLPGVTIDYDGEDAASMRLRGMDPSLANITLDGNEVASINDAESRSFNLKTQALQNIEAIEINVAPTADKPANTMGGSVNFVSKSALTQKGRRIRFTSNLSLNTSELNFDKTPGGARTPDRKIMPGFSLSYSEAFGSERPLGVAFNTSFNRNYRFNNRYTVPRYVYAEEELAANGGRVSPEMTGTVPELQWSESGSSTENRAVSLNLDWQVTPTTLVYLYSSYNDVTGLGAYNRSMRLAFGPHEAESDFYHAVTKAGTSVNMSYGVGAGDSTNMSFNGGAKHEIGDLRLNYNAFYSVGKTDPSPEKNFSVSYGYTGLGMNVYGLAGNATGQIEQRANQGTEVVSATDPRSYLNIKNYDSLTMAQNITYGTDTRRGGKLDATLPVSIPLPKLRPLPVEIKVGASYSEQERDKKLYWRRKRLTGGSNISNFGTAAEPVLYQFSDPYFRNTWSFDVPISNWLSPYSVWDYYQENPEHFYDDTNDSTGQIYRELNGQKLTKEGATAGYAQLTVRPVRNLTMTLGMRYEHTKLTAEGPEYENPYDDGRFFGRGKKYDTASTVINMPDNTPTNIPNPFYGMNWSSQKTQMIPMLFTRVKGTKAYGNYFPNVQLKYEPLKNLNVRLARTEAIGRADFSNIMPDESWYTNYHLIRRSNPDLQPQRSEKYDLAIEYYFKKTGMLSLSVFKQDMKNIIQSETIYITNTHDPEAPLDGSTVYEPDYEEGQWSVETPRNIGKGENKGFEVAYRQRLGFIASWLDDVQVYSSFSYADPKTWYQRKLVSPPRAPASQEAMMEYINSPTERTEIPMPGIQKKSGTLQLHYLGSRFSGKIAAFWVDKFARNINRSIVEINYQDAYIRYDLSLNYKLDRRWTATFDWRNVTDEGDSRHIFDRTGGYFTSGMVVNVGVRADF